jgi:hypothetical protein
MFGMMNGFVIPARGNQRSHGISTAKMPHMMNNEDFQAC